MTESGSSGGKKVALAFFSLVPLPRIKVTDFSFLFFLLLSSVSTVEKILKQFFFVPLTCSCHFVFYHSFCSFTLSLFFSIWIFFFLDVVQHSKKKFQHTENALLVEKRKCSESNQINCSVLSFASIACYL